MLRYCPTHRGIMIDERDIPVAASFLLLDHIFKGYPIEYEAHFDMDGHRYQVGAAVPSADIPAGYREIIQTEPDAGEWSEGVGPRYPSRNLFAR